ncbi:MAG: polyphenol oxidase family protein [FCB group bacterium]|nr:polyphenol oxidase family protein [FCB group bacterium]
MLDSESFFDFSDFLGEDLFAKLSKSAVFQPDRDLEQNRKIAAKAARVETADLAIPFQVHSSDVAWVNHPGFFNEIDGLLSENNRIVLTLQVADCLPVFIRDMTRNRIGLIHAGWRGLTAGILEKAVIKLRDAGTLVEDLKVYIGPAIQQEDYPVGAEVAACFCEKAKLPADNRWKVSLQVEALERLTKAGVHPGSVRISEISSFSNSTCQSYRRDGIRSGRMFAFMGVKK